MWWGDKLNVKVNVSIGTYLHCEPRNCDLGNPNHCGGNAKPAAAVASALAAM